MAIISAIIRAIPKICRLKITSACYITSYLVFKKAYRFRISNLWITIRNKNEIIQIRATQKYKSLIQIEKQ